MPLYTESSTTFGSIMIMRTSSGLYLKRRDMMSVLMQTDLPEPVAPAMSRCGIFAMSVTIVLPAMSFPTPNASFAFAPWNSLLPSTSPR